MNNDKFVAVGFSIKANQACANIDYKYGPYTSKEEAYTALGEEGDDVIAIGLTVGIKTDKGIVEYWFKNGTTLDDLVQKTNDELVRELNVLREEINTLKNIFPTADEDGNGIPDGEDRLRKIEENTKIIVNEDGIVL